MITIIRYTTFLLSFVGFLTAYTAAEADQELPSQWSMARFQLALTKGGALSTETLEQQEIRRQAIDAILKIYQILNSKGRYRIYENEAGRTEDLYVGPHWEYLPIEGTQSPARQTIWALLPKLNTRATLCFSDLETTPEFVLECMNASFIACAKICETFAPHPTSGAEFDGSFFTNEAYLMKIARRNKTKISPSLRLTTITGSYFFDQEFTKVTKGAANIEPADYIYLGGHPEYLSEHPVGYGAGDYVFFVGFGQDGPKQYIGFGSFFKDGPKTAQEIQKELAKEYRGKNRLEEEIPYTEADLEAAFQKIRGVPANYKKFLVGNVEEIRKQYPSK